MLTLALTVPLLAGCAGQSGDGQSRDGRSDGPSGGRSTADTAADGRSADHAADPATWVLPLQAYLPDPEQKDLLFDAVEKAKSACMKRSGFDYRPAGKMPVFGPETLTDLRYGIHDRKVAATYGYKPAGDIKAYQEEQGRLLKANELSQEEEAVMTGSGTSEKVPEGGCWGEARREVYGTLEPVSTLANDLSNEAYTEAGKSERVRSVFRSWSRCMARSGYSYDEPLDAPGDPGFAALKASPEEIATALADLDCRAEYRVAEIWFDEETRLQNKAVKGHAQALEKDGETLDTAVRTAARTTEAGS